MENCISGYVWTKIFLDDTVQRLTNKIYLNLIQNEITAQLHGNIKDKSDHKIAASVSFKLGYEYLKLQHTNPIPQPRDD